MSCWTFQCFHIQYPNLLFHQLSIKLHVVAFKEFSISPRSFLSCNFFIGVFKDWAAKKVTIFNSITCLLKLQKMVYFFTCILPHYLANEITKELWNNSHFESLRADFPLRCQKSLRWNTPKIMHFQTRAKSIFTIIVPKWLFFSLNLVCTVSR